MMSFPDLGFLLGVLATLHALIALWLALYGLHSWCAGALLGSAAAAVGR